MDGSQIAELRQIYSDGTRTVNENQHQSIESILGYNMFLSIAFLIGCYGT